MKDKKDQNYKNRDGATVNECLAGPDQKYS